MSYGNTKNVYTVEFLLSFAGEVRNGSAPYRGSREVVLDGNTAQSDQLKAELAGVVRRYIAGLNEFPEEMVKVELVKFDRKEI